MANVSMSTEALKRAFQFFGINVLVVGGAWAMARQFAFGEHSLTAFLQGLQAGIDWAAVFSFWALRRPWTSEWLAKWTGHPIIHGVWFGHLDTNYGAAAGTQSTRIPIAFVIKQTFLGYSLLSYTERQDSETLMEQLTVDDQHKTVLLRYVYEFQIMKPDERKLTLGSGQLKVLESGKRLRGHYMTNSPTQGSADLALVQRNCEGIDTFEAVRRLYQEKLPAAQSPAHAPAENTF